jgi:carbon dioxide concentrating mechanism protein CcmO
VERKQLRGDYEQSTQTRSFRDASLGLVSTRSFPAIVGTADTMLKSAGVSLVGFEKIGSGYCTAIVRGRIGDVRLAVESGVQVAEDMGQYVSSLVIARPQPNLEVILPIGSRLTDLADDSYSSLSNKAIGLLETRGFPAMVGASDAMLKAAEVMLASYETIGDGLCTAIVRGSVADVAVAVEAGMREAERIGEFSSLMIIPRPLDDMEKILPLASCWIEKKAEPLMLPISVKEQEVQLVELPELNKLPISIKE